MNCSFMIDKSVENWEIIQQSNGFAYIDLCGTYEQGEADAELIVRVFDEFTDEPMTEWERVSVFGNQWNTKIKLQEGGTYRIEIRIWNRDGGKA